VLQLTIVSAWVGDGADVLELEVVVEVKVDDVVVAMPTQYASPARSKLQ
jgi:hypothetical protein